MTDRITIEEITELCGVNKAAVSNWRRPASSTFPAPLADSPKRPLQFDRTAVMEWLEANRPHLLERTRSENFEAVITLLLDHLGTFYDDRQETALAALRIIYLVLHKAPQNATKWDEILNEVTKRAKSPLPAFALRGLDGDLNADERSLKALWEHDLNDLLATKESVKQVCEDTLRLILDKAATAKSQTLGFTESPSTQLLQIAAATAGEPDFVHAAACGIGSALLTLPPSTAINFSDVDPTAVAITELRLHLHGFTDIEAEVRDVLTSPPHGSADLSLVKAPHHTQTSATGFDASDPRWQRFGDVRGTHAADAAFLIDALTPLDPGGRAFVVTSGDLLTAKGLRELRTGLVAGGHLEAVIEYPSTRDDSTDALWVLRGSDSAGTTLISASTSTEVATHLTAWLHALQMGQAPATAHVVVDPVGMAERQGHLTTAAWSHTLPSLTTAEDSWEEAAQALNDSLAELRGFANAPAEGDVPSITPLDLGAAPDFDAAPMVTVAELIRRHVLTLIPCHLHPKPQSGHTWTRSLFVVPVGHDSGDLAREDFRRTVLVSDDYPAGKAGDVAIPLVGDHLAFFLPAFTVPGFEFTVTSASRVVRVNDHNVLDARYLTYCVDASWNAPTVTSGGRSRRALKDIRIPMIPLEDQRKFVDYIDALEVFHYQLDTAIAQTALLKDRTLNGIAAAAAEKK